MPNDGSGEALSILLDPVKRSEAEGLFRRLRAAVQEKEGSDSAEAAVLSNKLGEIIAFDGRHSEAVELFWRAIRSCAARSEVSQQVAIYYRNLGLSLAILDRCDDAILAIQTMVGILEQCVGAKHGEVAQARSLLADISKGWKPPLPNARPQSSARAAENMESTTTNTVVAEFNRNYSTWENAYLKSAPDTPQGYLIRLQRLRNDPLSDSPYNQLRSASWMLGRSLQGHAPEITGAVFSKNVAFAQTYYIQELLLAPVRRYFPNTIQKILPNLAFGALPVRSVNGCALRAPKGGHIIVLDSGLFSVLSYFFESLCVAPRLNEAGRDADAYSNDTYHFICEYYRDRGDVQFAFPEPSETLSDHELMISCLRLECAELFILCHEIAHVALGHVEDPESMALQSRTFQEALARADETTLLVHSYDEAKELMADIVGFSLFRSVWFHHPILAPVTKEPEMRELWEYEALLVFSLLSLIEKNVPSYTGISSHPPVDRRLEALFYQAAREVNAAGYQFSEGNLPPAMEWIRRHSQMARNMPVLNERIAHD
jgi:hypothetical protein